MLKAILQGRSSIKSTIMPMRSVTAHMCLHPTVPANLLDESEPVLFRVHCEYNRHVCKFRIEGRYEQQCVERGR